MFDSLSSRLGDVFGKLRGRGALTEADVRAAMREVRIALLEADVALPVVRSFVDQVTELAIGQNVLRSVTPGQQVVKIVSDALTEMLGSETAELELAVTPPAVIMMVGLQGSGKTTTTAKIAKRLKEKERKKVLMASLDVNRPAAQEQLAVLGQQIDVATLPIVAGQQPVEIAQRAMQCRASGRHSPAASPPASHAGRSRRAAARQRSARSRHRSAGRGPQAVPARRGG